MSNCPLPGYTPSGLWRIKGTHNSVYLAATSHVVTEDQVPFPSPFYAAFRKAKEIYLEVDADRLSLVDKIHMMFKLRKWIKSHATELACPASRTLGDLLAPSTVERLKILYGRDYAKRERLTPLGVAFLGQIEALAKQYGKTGGVDEVFALEARREHKPIRVLDDHTVNDVVVLVLDQMLLELRLEIARRGPDRVIAEKVLSDKPAVSEGDEEDAGWRHGDLAAIEREIEAAKRESPSLYEKMGPQRNRNWFKKLKLALQARHDVMVLAGATHFGGEEGLLEMLRKAGYAVEPMYGVDRPYLGSD